MMFSSLMIDFQHNARSYILFPPPSNSVEFANSINTASGTEVAGAYSLETLLAGDRARRDANSNMRAPKIVIVQAVRGIAHDDRHDT
jgi:hypothetical protein